MLTSYIHEFHFVMDRSMKENIKKLNWYKETRSLSGVIVKILSLIAPILKKEHIWGKQRMSRYLPVCNNPDEIREHVHVYFPGEVYREIKLMHADLNCFSIAQLVRGFLNLFLALVKEFGNNIFKELKRLFERWKDEDEKNNLTHCDFIRQLKIITQHLSKQNILVTIYNSKYLPLWIFHH